MNGLSAHVSHNSPIGKCGAVFCRVEPCSVASALKRQLDQKQYIDVF